MTIRFAAAHPEHNPLIARFLGAAMRRRAANDNVLGICSDKLLKAALQHFAEYGMGAAEHAETLAEAAAAAGDADTYRWWLSICRALDRRMAEALATRIGLPAQERLEATTGHLG